MTQDRVATGIGSRLAYWNILEKFSKIKNLQCQNRGDKTPSMKVQSLGKSVVSYKHRGEGGGRKQKISTLNGIRNKWVQFSFLTTLPSICNVVKKSFLKKMNNPYRKKYKCRILSSNSTRIIDTDGRWLFVLAYINKRTGLLDNTRISGIQWEFSKWIDLEVWHPALCYGLSDVKKTALLL